MRRSGSRAAVAPRDSYARFRLSIRAHHVGVVRLEWCSVCTTPHRFNPPPPRCACDILIPRTAPHTQRIAEDSAQVIRPVGGRDAGVAVVRFAAPRVAGTVYRSNTKNEIFADVPGKPVEDAASRRLSPRGRVRVPQRASLVDVSRRARRHRDAYQTIRSRHATSSRAVGSVN